MSQEVTQFIQVYNETLGESQMDILLWWPAPSAASAMFEENKYQYVTEEALDHLVAVCNNHAEYKDVLKRKVVIQMDDTRDTTSDEEEDANVDNDDHVPVCTSTPIRTPMDDQTITLNEKRYDEGYECTEDMAYNDWVKEEHGPPVDLDEKGKCSEMETDDSSVCVKRKRVGKR